MLARAQGMAAGAVILDLEDAVAPDQKQTARSLVAKAVRARNIAVPTFVRINPLEDGSGYADLAQVVAPGLQGVMLPKATTTAQLEALGHALREAEVVAGVEAGS